VSVFDAIASLGEDILIVTRASAGAYVKGRYIDGPTALVVADDVVEAVNVDDDELTLTAHGLVTGDGPFQLTTDDTLPTGLALATDYWIVRVDANTVQLAASLDDAMAVPRVVVDIADVGVGEHTLSDTATTERQNRETFAASAASVQPVDGATLQDLPEGQRTDELRLIFTTTALKARTPTTEPDVVTIDGEPWIIIRAKRWRAFGGAHTEAYAARTEAP